MRQLELTFPSRGGKRRGAGRKPKGAKAGVSHARRPQFARTLPVHVTLRMAPHVYNLRSRRSFGAIGRALAVAADRFGVRIVQFSVQGNHVHLVVEAADAAALSRAMQGFSIRVAKRLNKMMDRRGRVLGDRYHAHPLRTPTEVRRAVRYVRENHRKHMAQIGRPFPRGWTDEYTSDGATIVLPKPKTWPLRTVLPPP
jgi:REP element-mobilizing transposase RayT